MRGLGIVSASFPIAGGTRTLRPPRFLASQRFRSCTGCRGCGRRASWSDDPPSPAPRSLRCIRPLRWLRRAVVAHRHPLQGRPRVGGRHRPRRWPPPSRYPRRSWCRRCLRRSCRRRCLMPRRRGPSIRSPALTRSAPTSSRRQAHFRTSAGRRRTRHPLQRALVGSVCRTLSRPAMMRRCVLLRRSSQFRTLLPAATRGPTAADLKPSQGARPKASKVNLARWCSCEKVFLRICYFVSGITIGIIIGIFCIGHC